jgi:hypothetical protein
MMDGSRKTIPADMAGTATCVAGLLAVLIVLYGLPILLK